MAATIAAAWGALPGAVATAPGGHSWETADLRVVLDLGGASPAIEVRGPDGQPDPARGRLLSGCGAVGHTRTFFDREQGGPVDMLDVDLGELLNCAHARDLLDEGRRLDDDTNGGLVFYFGVEGPAKGGADPYGVRVFNAARLASSVTGAPQVRGLTVVTDRALYVRGDYNSVDRRPAALLAGSLNVLSNAWNDAAPGGRAAERPAAATTIDATFLAGGDLAGAGSDRPHAGLDNFPRFHENWSEATLTYRGSFGSQSGSLHAEGAH